MRLISYLAQKRFGINGYLQQKYINMKNSGRHDYNMKKTIEARVDIKQRTDGPENAHLRFGI